MDVPLSRMNTVHSSFTTDTEQPSGTAAASTTVTEAEELSVSMYRAPSCTVCAAAALAHVTYTSVFCLFVSPYLCPQRPRLSLETTGVRTRGARRWRT